MVLDVTLGTIDIEKGSLRLQPVYSGSTVLPPVKG